MVQSSDLPNTGMLVSDDVQEFQASDDFLEKTLENLSALEYQDLLQSVVNDFNQWKIARQPLEQKWQECWEAYLCDSSQQYNQTDSDYGDRSQVFRPVLYESVEAIQANLLNSLFPSDEWFFSVSGQTEVDHQHADTIEAYLRNKLESLNFTEKYALFLKQAIITGNSVAAVPWQHKTRQRRINKPVEVLGVPVGSKKETITETVFSGPDFQVLDIFDFILDPNQPDFEQTKVIRKLKRSLSEIENNPAYSNLEGLIESDTDEDNVGKNSKRHAFGIQTAGLNQTSTHENHIDLLEVWGDFNLEGTLYNNYVCVVARAHPVSNGLE